MSILAGSWAARSSAPKETYIHVHVHKTFAEEVIRCTNTSLIPGLGALTGLLRDVRLCDLRSPAVPPRVNSQKYPVCRSHDVVDVAKLYAKFLLLVIAAEDPHCYKYTGRSYL